MSILWLLWSYRVTKMKLNRLNLILISITIIFACCKKWEFDFYEIVLVSISLWLLIDRGSLPRRRRVIGKWRSAGVRLNDYRNMWNVWRTVLEENEKLARAHLAAVEVFQQQIADDAKILRMHKLQISKKV